MKKSITFDLKLPKTVRVDSVTIGSIPLDESWRVTVKEDRRTIGEMSLGAARRKYA